MAAPGKRALRNQIQRTGGDVSEIADYYEVTKRTVYNWIKRKDLDEALEQARQVAEQDERKADLIRMLRDCGGNVSAVANEVGKSRATVYNWIRDLDLWDEVNRTRYGLVQIAEDNVYTALLDGDLDISKYVLERKGRAFGWGKSIEHSGILGATLFTAEDIARIQAAGIDVSEVVRQFMDMINAHALAEATGSDAE